MGWFGGMRTGWTQPEHAQWVYHNSEGDPIGWVYEYQAGYFKWFSQGQRGIETSLRKAQKKVEAA